MISTVASSGRRRDPKIERLLQRRALAQLERRLIAMSQRPSKCPVELPESAVAQKRPACGSSGRTITPSLSSANVSQDS